MLPKWKKTSKCETKYKISVKIAVVESSVLPFLQSLLIDFSVVLVRISYRSYKVMYLH